MGGSGGDNGDGGGGTGGDDGRGGGRVAAAVSGRPLGLTTAQHFERWRRRAPWERQKEAIAHALMRDRARSRSEVQTSRTASHGERGITRMGGHRAHLPRADGAETAFAVAFRPKSLSFGKTPFGKKVTLWAENGGHRPRRGRRQRGGHGGGPRTNLKILTRQIAIRAPPTTAAHSDRSGDLAGDPDGPS